MPNRLHGAIAAAVTPLKDGGRTIDPDAFAPLVGFLATGGVDGLLACGTTGEGVLLSVDERRHVAEAFLAAGPTASRSRSTRERRRRGTRSRSPPTRWRSARTPSR